MKLYQLRRTQRLALSIADAWDFFSRPENLRHITPGWLDFALLTDVPEQMHTGTVIAYTIRPVLGVPIRWVTEITHIDAPHFFVDEQRFGPYKFWHHQHHFRAIDGGVEMEDLVHYGLPFGPLGQVAHALTVRRRLEAIFAFRRQALDERFGTM